MSGKLDPREVLAYLNELGYCNISAEQLKEFMKDLKKLMKYDMKKCLKENYVDIPCRKNKSHEIYRSPCKDLNLCESRKAVPESSTRKGYESQDLSYLYKPYVNKYVDDVFSNLYSASTVSSRAKSVHQDRNVPGVSFAPKKSKSQFISSAESVQSSYYTGISEKYRQNSLPRSKSATRPKSFIRPALSLHSSKSDPVSLYQRYQEDWKKHKMPGEDNHNKLRWAIREKMLGQPDIQPIPLSRKVRL